MRWLPGSDQDAHRRGCPLAMAWARSSNLVVHTEYELRSSQRGLDTAATVRVTGEGGTRQPHFPLLPCWIGWMGAFSASGLAIGRPMPSLHLDDITPESGLGQNGMALFFNL